MLRETELRLAYNENPEHPRVKLRYSGVSTFVCVEAYIVLCGLPRSSVWRTMGRIKTQVESRYTGRPQRDTLVTKRDGRTEINTPMKEHTLQWIINWAEFISEDSPVGSKYLKTIDIITPAEVYEEYANEFDSIYFTVHSNHVSIHTFCRVWKYWLKKYKVHVRDKKNVTTKCDGALLWRYSVIALYSYCLFVLPLSV